MLARIFQNEADENILIVKFLASPVFIIDFFNIFPNFFLHSATPLRPIKYHSRHPCKSQTVG